MIQILCNRTMMHMYAWVTEPTIDEKDYLARNGFQYFSACPITNETDPDHGKLREMWVRDHYFMRTINTEETQ